MKVNRKETRYCVAGAAILAALVFVSLITGKYPLSLDRLLSGDPLQRRIFWTLRFSRTLVGVVGGFALGIAGFIYQTVFRNPLASPDIIGHQLRGQCRCCRRHFALFRRRRRHRLRLYRCTAGLGNGAGPLSAGQKREKQHHRALGIAVHALAQTVLMCLKLMADPQRQLASIEYWIMGSLSGISGYSMGGNLILSLSCLVVLFFLHRQILLLAQDEGEARLLGVSVGRLRLVILLLTTLVVSSIVSLTGLISFIGLLAPHIARLLTGNNRPGTMALGGILGAILLCGADILARSLASVELPVSIFTSLLGVPFLIFLLIRGRRSL